MDCLNIPHQVYRLSAESVLLICRGVPDAFLDFTEYSGPKKPPVR